MYTGKDLHAWCLKESFTDGQLPAGASRGVPESRWRGLRTLVIDV
ncbi:hypothetical protein [Amycolatopsis sp. WAC 01375]|nr:hypothetical protein [Amycolatopsis sp. WAC 01375]